MIQLTPQMRLLVCVDPADFRKGIDGLCALCRKRLAADPFSGVVFIFRNQRATAVKLLTYDGQGFWLCLKRLSKGHFAYWPTADAEVQREMLAHELQVLLAGGDPDGTRAAPQWRRLPRPVP